MFYSSPDKGRLGGGSSCEALPPGWVRINLGDVVDYGRTVKVEPSEIEDDAWILELEDIQKNTSKLLVKAYCSERKSKSTKNKFEQGDVLYGKLRPYLDKVIIADQDGYCSTEILPLKKSDYLDNRYLFYSLKSREFIQYVSEVSYGVNMPRLGTQQGKNAPFMLPPLPEQIRIANKLDSLLAKVETAQTRLEKIPALLKRFRQAVLAAATSGELTREWRGESVKWVNDQYLTWGFRSLPLTWLLKLLPEVGEARLGKMLDKNKNEGIPTKYLANINVRWGSFDLNDLKEIKVSTDEQEELSIRDGDLLLCEGGVPGRGAVWRYGVNNLVFQKAIHRIRFNDNILPEYVLFCVEDDFNQNRLSSLYTGTTIKHLTGQALKKYPIKVPPIEEQAEIVRRVESLFAMADTVEKQYQAAKARMDKLTQAILAKAFRGELVPQDPNDEPASELLQRINKEKEHQQNMSKVQAIKLKRTALAYDIPKVMKNEIRVMNLQEVPDNYLLNLLEKNGGEAYPETLWKQSGLSIDDFYAKLKQELGLEKFIDDNESPDPSLRKLKIV